MVWGIGYGQMTNRLTEYSSQRIYNDFKNILKFKFISPDFRDSRPKHVSQISIVSSFSENHLSIKDTIYVINDVVQLVDEASCSSKMNSNVEIVSSFSENHLNMKDTIDVIDDVVQLVNEASCSSKISNVEEYSTGLEMQACKGVLSGYKEILEVLKILSEDTTQSPPTRHEANSIKKKLEKLEFVFMLKVWTPILQRFDATSKTLQSKDINLSIIVSLYESLEFYVQGYRKLFDNILNKSKGLCGKSTFSWEKSRVIKKKRYFDDSNSTDTIHHGDDKMKNETFYVIIDTLSSHLCERKKAYKTSIQILDS
ncbi:hypothetical protein ACI65C_006644 [Semiaphis heraclei]